MIAYGHAAADAWSYTPRQLEAFLFLAEKRRLREYAAQLHLARLAAHGKPEDVKKQLKEWEK